MRVQPLGDFPLYAVERAATDKQYIPSVHVYVVLVGMFAASLGWNVHHRAFQKLQQPLLHAFAAHVARDGRIVTLACDLVDFVNEDNSPLSRIQVIVGHLQQTAEDALHILAT